MIRIRYKDLAASPDGVTWLYGRIERDGGETVLYLAPGLTAGQRRAAIRRLRQEASRGFGPPLPRPQLLTALAADRLRAAARLGAAIVRLHPVAALIPGVGLAALAALIAVTSVGPGGFGPGAGDQSVAAAAMVGGPAPRPMVAVTAAVDGRARSLETALAATSAPGRSAGLYACRRVAGVSAPWRRTGQRPHHRQRPRRCCSKSRSAP